MVGSDRAGCIAGACTLILGFGFCNTPSMNLKPYEVRIEHPDVEGPKTVLRVTFERGGYPGWSEVAGDTGKKGNAKTAEPKEKADAVADADDTEPVKEG